MTSSVPHMCEASFHFCTTRGGRNSSSAFYYQNRIGLLVWNCILKKKKRKHSGNLATKENAFSLLFKPDSCVTHVAHLWLTVSSRIQVCSEQQQQRRRSSCSNVMLLMLLTSCICIFKPCLPISSDATSFAATKAFIKTFHICIDSPTNCKQTFICKIHINSARINKLVLFSLPERSWKERRSRNVKKVHTDYFQNTDFVLTLLWALWLTRGRAVMCGGGREEGWTKQRDTIHHSWEAGKSCHYSDSHPLCCIMGSLFANP